MPRHPTWFQKGQSGNPKGRPKQDPTQFGEYKQALGKLRDTAGGDYEKAYSILIASVEKGESWAQRIFWDKFLPNGAVEDRVAVKLPQKEVKEDITCYLMKFVSALSDFDGYTKDDVLHVIRVLSALKLDDSKIKSLESIYDVLDDNEILSLMDTVAKAKNRRATTP